MNNSRSGMALLLSIGVLAVLTLVAVGFSIFSSLELKAARNYFCQMQAELIAEAGISRAIQELKYGSSGAIQDPYDTVTENWFYQGKGSSGTQDEQDNPVKVDIKDALYPSLDSLDGITGNSVSENFAGGTYKLKIVDCAALIDINTPLPDSGAEANFERLLTNLKDSLGNNIGLDSTQAQSLIAYRKNLPDGKFMTKEEIKRVAGITDVDYNKIKNFITLYGDADSGTGHTDKVFVNVNTAPFTVLWAVLRPMLDSDSNCTNLINAITTRRSTNSFDGKNPDANIKNFLSARGEFRRFVEYYASINVITAAERDKIITQTDPNRNATNTTHFSFDSGGYYEIETIGNYPIGSYPGASRKIKKAVYVYKKIYETTRQEFSVYNSNTALITLKNNCPINYSSLKKHIYVPGEGITVPDAIKSGFWDDFEEDYSAAGTDTGEWKLVSNPLLERFEINAGGNGMLRTWPAGLFFPNINYFPRVELDQTKWKFSSFSIRVRLIDETSNSKSSLRLNLPWPAVPQGWESLAPEVNATNCYDVINEKETLEDVKNNVKDINAYERFMNVAQLQFGSAAIYCSFPQTVDIYDESPNRDVPLYSTWVNYDGTGYIWFAPAPEIKPYNIINNPQVMVFMNTWVWGGHQAIDGTKTFSIPAYYPDKTIYLKSYGQRDLDATIYYPGGSLDIDTGNEPLMDWTNRVIRIIGMDNLFDMDAVRIIPYLGIYTSKAFDPTGSNALNMLEWGTISAGVSLEQGAQTNTEPVALTTNYTSGEDMTKIPNFFPPANAPLNTISPSGGAINAASTSPNLTYRIYMFSGFNDLNTRFENTPVVEDVTITYLPKTKILSQMKY